MSDDWSAKKRIAGLAGIIVFILLVVFLIVSDSAHAVLDMGDIRNRLEDESNKGCEYVSISDGMFTPVEIRIETSFKSPNFRGTVDPLSGDLKYQDETIVGNDESIFRFTTDSIGEFRLTIDDFLNRTNVDRNYFYRIEVSDANNAGNIEKELGNWNTDERRFCKVIDFTTEEPFTERTEEEILEITEKDRKERDEKVDAKLEEMTASSTILTVLFLLLVIYEIGRTVLGVYNRKKPENDMKKIRDYLIDEITRLKETIRFLDTWTSQKNLDFENWKQMFVALMYDGFTSIKNQPDKKIEFNLKPAPNPYMEMASKHDRLNLKKFTSDLRDKIRKTEKDPMAEFIETVLGSDYEKLVALYEEWNKKANDNRDDKDAYEKCVFIYNRMNEIRRREK